MNANRKPNRLKNYDYSSQGAYFITICTKDRRCILSTIVGDDAYIVPLCDAHIVPEIKLTHYGEIVKKYIDSIPGIDKYVIMPNHIHLLIVIDGPMRASAPTISVPSLIRSFKILVSKEIGCGIWQRSYYDDIIRDEEDYLNHWQYIENNPAKWSEDKYYTM